MPELIEKGPREIDTATIQDIQNIADYARLEGMRMVQTAGSGHLGALGSSAELMSALYFGGGFHFDPDNPHHPARDRIVVRGHVGPLRYPLFSLMGYVEKDELPGYRQLGSRLQGHEDMDVLPGVDITPSGSLGMLLSYGVGSAIELKHEDNPGRIIVFLGDGEEQEGNVSEAARHAASMDLDNLICILDKNSKQLSRPTHDADGGSNVHEIWKGYGWDVIEIQDGHDVSEILQTYKALQDIHRPTLVIANTVKGKGIPGAEESYNGYHTVRTCSPEALSTAIDTYAAKKHTFEEISRTALGLIVRPRDFVSPVYSGDEVFHVEIDSSMEDMGLKNAQDSYFQALVRQLEDNPDHPPFYAITPDYIIRDNVKRLGFGSLKGYFIDTGIREQHAVAMLHGISVTNPAARTLVYTGDAFALRPLDQINAAVQGKSRITMIGGDSGITNDMNGKTHQSVAQPGALLQIPGLNFYEPADVRDYMNVLNTAFVNNDGFNYIRLHWGSAKKLQRDAADIDSTSSYVVHEPDSRAKAVIMASGFPVANSVEAAKQLEHSYNTPTRVINVINQKGLREQIASYLDSDAPVLAVYNGNPEVLKSTIASSVMSQEYEGNRPKFIEGHGFTEGTSGKLTDLQRHFQLDVAGIVQKLLSTVRR